MVRVNVRVSQNNAYYLRMKCSKSAYRSFCCDRVHTRKYVIGLVEYYNIRFAESLIGLRCRCWKVHVVRTCIYYIVRVTWWYVNACSVTRVLWHHIECAIAANNQTKHLRRQQPNICTEPPTQRVHDAFGWTHVCKPHQIILLCREMSPRWVETHIALCTHVRHIRTYPQSCILCS